VDKLALRAGGEKDEEEADTVGVCTLRVGHLNFVPPCTLKLDFLGEAWRIVIVIVIVIVIMAATSLTTFTTF